MNIRSVCVFCGSRAGASPRYVEIARRAGTMLAERGLTLVYGGGSRGMMGAVADGVLDAGGSVIGVIPDFLIDKEVAHPRVKDMRVVRSMLDRKTTMLTVADSFLTLPGGYGTLDELFEVVTWNQLGTITKPCGILNIDGFYTPVIQQVELMIREGYILPHNRDLMLDDDDLERLLQRMIVWARPVARA